MRDREQFRHLSGEDRANTAATLSSGLSGVIRAESAFSGKPVNFMGNIQETARRLLDPEYGPKVPLEDLATLQRSLRWANELVEEAIKRASA